VLFTRGLTSGATPCLLAVVVFAGAAVLLTGCATRGSVRRIEARLDNVATDIAAMRERQVTVTQEAAPLIAELRMTTARLHEIEVRLREVGERIAVLGSRVTATESSLREAIAAVEALPRVESAPPAERSRPAAVSADGDRAFAAALATFRSGEHGQAVLDLMDFLARYPDHPLAPRAQLWIGEAYFKQRDYQQALLEYRKVVDVAPGSPSAAEAWVKIGQAYSMLRQRPAAASAWERVVREHPGTEAAARARSLLRK
jgi:tol-pal system protein YbgF